MNAASEVISVFERFRMPPTAIDQFGQGGRDMLMTQLSTFVTADQPIRFLMLGFPIKSTNHEHKTLGELPDLAEEVAFQNFRKFGEEMSKVHPAGVHLDILSDGFVFNDLLEEKDRVVDAYAEVARDMARETPVTVLGLRELFPGVPLADAREKVVNNFGVTELELERRILVDPNVNALYRGMIKFMEEELANRQFPSKRQHHLASKKLAKAMMFRNEAYSGLATSEFPQSIRLSMHPTTNVGKYGFQLIPSPLAYMSPWHCALLINGEGQYVTIHKKDAEASGAQLVYRDSRPYFYQAV